MKNTEKDKETGSKPSRKKKIIWDKVVVLAIVGIFIGSGTMVSALIETKSEINEECNSAKGNLSIMTVSENKSVQLAQDSSKQMLTPGPRGSQSDIRVQTTKESSERDVNPNPMEEKNIEQPKGTTRDFKETITEVAIESSSDSIQPVGEPTGGTGSGWVTDRKVIAHSTTDKRPSIATDSNGNLYVAENYYYSGSGTYAINVYKSIDGGDSWSYFHGWYYSSYDIYYPSIAIDPYDNRIYVAYELEYTSSNYGIYCKVYTPGSGWASAVGVDTDAGNDRYPSIASDFMFGSGNRQYISYEHLNSYDDREMHVAKSTNHGVTWNPWHDRGYGIVDYNVHTQTSITIATDGWVYVAYAWGSNYGDQKDLVVEYGPRTSTSSTFENQVWVYDASANSNRGASWPSIAASHGNNLKYVIAWQRYYSSSDDDVRYAYTTNGGTSWSLGSISGGTKNERYPQITVDGQGSTSSVTGYFHVAYYYDGRVHYKRASDSNMGIWSNYYGTNPIDDDGGIESGWRYIGITTQKRNDNNWYPAVVFTDYETGGYDIYYTTPGATYTITTDPTGLTIEIDDVSYTAPKSKNWIAGYSHTIYAPSPQNGYIWDSWSDGGAQSHSITIGTSDKTIIAYYITRQWTVIAYLAGDSDLASWCQNCLNYMKNVGSQNGIEIVALIDKNLNGDTKAYHVMPGSLINIPLSNIHSGWSNEVNTGDPNTLIYFAKYCINTYEASHYLIIPQNHGGSWRGCCWDYTLGRDRLDLSDLKTAFSSIKSHIGKKIDVIFFNDCLMCATEVTNQVRPYADYMVGSETISYTTTWDNEYVTILSQMVNNPSITPQQLAVYIISYGTTPKDSSYYKTQSVSCIDLSKISDLVSSVNTFSTNLKDKLSLYRTEIEDARDATEWVMGPTDELTNRIIDLYRFAQRIKSYVPDSTIQSSAQDVMNKIGPAGGSIGYVVMKERHTSSVSFCHGLSIYFPSDESLYDSSYTIGNDFTATTQWDEFLSEYYNQPCTLSSGSVSPSSGDTTTIFTYEVTYTDPDGDAPITKDVYINGSPHTMTYISGSYTTGTLFRYQTTLPEGSHNYYFLFNDGHGHSCRLPTSGSYSGPSVSPPNQPCTLSSGSVSPSSGDTTTIFTYEVTYTDPDGDAPTTKDVYINGSPHTMTYISGSYTTGTLFRYQTTLPEGSHNYYFLFNDGHGHSCRLPTSGSYSGPSVSPPSEKPEIKDVQATPDYQLPGGYVNITCNVTDDIEVDTVKVNITYPEDSEANETMTKILGTNDCYYNTTYSIPGTYYYFIWANDTSGNGNTSSIYSFVIQDTTLPEITNVMDYPDPQETGGYVNITCDVTDNVGVDTVKVNITGPVGFTPINVTMSGGSYYYNTSYTIIGTYHYFVWANDTSNNGNKSATYSFVIQDNTQPEIIDNTPSIGYTGDAFTFNVTVTDNIQVSTVWVEYWYGTGSHINVSMTNVADDYWEKSIIVDDTLEILHYIISANDTSNNWNDTGVKDVTIHDNDPPEIKDVQHKINGYVNITCNVTDNIEVNVVKVNITYPNGTIINVTMTGGSYYYNATYTILGTYYYFIWANDTSGNENTSSIYSFVIQDNTSPEITNVMDYPDPQEVSGWVNITCDVTDNIEVNTVMVNITGPAGFAPINVSMSGGSYYYNASYTVPGIYYYFIWANDTMGNENTSATFTFTIQEISDTISPEIKNVADYPDPQFVGGWVNITCTVTDNVEVDTVKANITYPASGINATMTNILGTSTYYYNSTHSLPGTYNYFIWANDTSDNRNTSTGHSFLINDTIPPEITNVEATPDPQEVNGHVNITCNVTDNVGVNEVWVNITYPDSTTHNFSMNGGSYYFNQTYLMAGTYNYFIWANDTSGNANTSTTYTFTIQELPDTVPPEITNVTDYPDPQILGGWVNISCNVVDNVAVDKVMVNITGPPGFIPVNVSMIEGSYYYNTTYTMLGTYYYFIWVNDTSENSNMSSGDNFVIQDTTPPEITNVQDYPDPQETGGYVNISCDVTDNVLVDTVKVNITYPDGSTVNVSMMGGSYYYNTTYTMLGTYYYFIRANDTSNNGDVSSTNTFTIQDIGTIVSIQDCTASPGDTITVPIIIYNVSKIMTADVNLTFSPSVVHVLSAGDSDFDAMIPNIDNTSGWVRIGAFQILSGALSGDVVLANLTLQAVGSAGDVSPLNFTHIYLEDETAVEIPATPDNGTFTVEDTVSPEILNLQAIPLSQTQHGYVNTSAVVIDNVAVGEVYLNITYPDGSYENFSITQNTTDSTCYCNRTYDIAGTYDYFIWANDTSNNGNKSSTSSFIIQDTTPPEIMNVQDSPDPQETGGYVNITCDVSDNVAVDEVWVNITYPDSSYHNFSMNPGSYYYNQTYSTVGIYYYFIWANDTSGNWNVCGIFRFSIIDSTPPEFGSISVSLPVIPEDTDGNPLWGELTNISAVISDNSNITSVVIDLTPIGGSLIPMIHVDDTDTWYIETNASIGSAFWNGSAYIPHLLQINATDEHGNWNVTYVELTVVKNGDVNGDGKVTLFDATYLAKWYLNIPGFEEMYENVGDVNGDGKVSLFDATYLAKWYLNIQGFEVLK